MNDQRRAIELLAIAYNEERNDDPTESTAELLGRCLGALGYRLVPATEPAAPDTERAPPYLNGSQTGTFQEIMDEHRQCGPKYEGCYSHWPTPHCRADGMAWPCDVDVIRAAIGPHIHPPGQTDKRCAECYRKEKHDDG